MSFTFQRSLTIDHTQCGSADSSNFPVLVSLSHATLKDAAHSGHVQSSSGFDLVFYSDLLATIPLKWEMEFYDPANGIVIAWVKVPTISHSVDTVFYVCYGNASISTFQSTPTDVWPAQIPSVHHLSSLTADSTSNGNTLTNTAVTSGTGKIDGCGSYNGSAMQARAVPVGIPSKTYPIVLEAWVNPSSLGANQYVLMASQYQATFGNLFNMALDATGHIYVYNGSLHQVSAASALSTSTWSHVVVDIQSTVLAIIYLNGAGFTCTLDGSPVTDYGNPEITIGDQDVMGTAPFNGLIDEVRIHIVSPTASWVLQSYNNQNNPGSFMSMGSEISGPSFIPALAGGSSQYVY